MLPFLEQILVLLGHDGIVMSTNTKQFEFITDLSNLFGKPRTVNELFYEPSGVQVKSFRKSFE